MGRVGYGGRQVLTAMRWVANTFVFGEPALLVHEPRFLVLPLPRRAVRAQDHWRGGAAARTTMWASSWTWSVPALPSSG